MRTWMIFAAIIGASAMGCSGGSSGHEQGQEHQGLMYPGETWVEMPPGEAGLSEQALETFSAYVDGSGDSSGCVVRHGYMVYAWGDPSDAGDVASAAKPVYAHFLFKAIEDGLIDGEDEPVSDWEPRLLGINDGKDAQITWRHLANQISGYGLADFPGEAFAYNDWQMALFWDTLFLEVYGASYSSVDANVLFPLLAEPLAFEDSPTFMAFGEESRPGRLAISPRDFARFGLLYLRAGMWAGQQILDPQYAVMAVTSPLPNTIPRAGFQTADMILDQRTIGSDEIPDNQTDHLGSYSWLWWVNGVDREGRRLWPSAPVDAYGAIGHYGRRVMIVLPGSDLIVSWNNSDIDDRDKLDEALRLLRNAVQ
jgi:CubicO group peptidase (beta-lactamase class C family)